MPCTTILVGKKASYDGSTIMARNEDAGADKFTPKRFIAVMPEEQPRLYRSVLSGVEIPLPEEPLRYTAMPNALPHAGIWGEAGFNSCNVAMSETETITSNARVQGADPLVSGGIGEEDMLTIVLPYIRSAREGVLRLGALLEQYGTYEMNGIGFQDVEEIWWLETIGGHHWLARRVPDDAYVVGPNQLGIDSFDFTDALGEKREYLCCADLPDFIEKHHLDLAMDGIPVREKTDFDVRAAFGSHADADHSYNTPRAWFMERYLNPTTYRWDGPGADFTPESDDLPWCMVPEKRITIEDVKYVLSGYYQGTPYDPYSRHSPALTRGMYRPIGVNRNNFLAITQLRPYLPEEIRAVEWLAVGSNVFNEVMPFYGNVTTTPAYLSCTTGEVTTESFYWSSRLIGALADANFHECIADIERYQKAMSGRGHAMLQGFDEAYLEKKPAEVCHWLEQCNEEFAAEAKRLTADVLAKVLCTTSLRMTNAFDRSDA